MRLFLCGFFLLRLSLTRCDAQHSLESFVENLKPLLPSEAFTEKHPRPEWRPNSLYNPPAGNRTLLGKFVSGKSADLELKNLPDHQYLLVRIEVIILCHWDGIWKEYGPDQWDATIVAGPTLLSTTFSNFTRAEQNFPDEIGSASHPFLSGSTSTGDYDFVKEMGENGKGWGNLDTTYHIWLAAEHTAKNASVRFSGKFHDEPDGHIEVGESWAIAGCQAWAIPADIHPNINTLEAALASLTDTALVPSTQMIATLVLSGEKGLFEIEKHLRAKGHDDLLPSTDSHTAPTSFASIIEKLSHDDFKTREHASKQLLLIVPQHRQELLALLSDHQDPEVRQRVSQALATFDAPRENRENIKASDKEVIVARLKNVLRLMTSDKASKWFADLD